MNIRRIAIVAASCGAVLLAGPEAVAQQAKMHGTVRDLSGEPVSGVKVLLQSTSSPGVRSFGNTKKPGSYLIGLIKSGTYELQVEAPGMAIQQVDARAVAGGDRKEAWKQAEAITAGKPVTFTIEDGQDITCDVVIGAAETTGAGSGSAGASGGGPVDAALAKVQSGQCEAAIPDLEAAAQATPDSARVQYLLGYCHANLEHGEQALAAVNRALEIQPDMPGVSLLKGQVLARLGRVEESEAAIKHELETTTEPRLTVDAWIGLGVLYRANKRDSDAVTAFEKVTELAPDRPESYVELATLYTRMGKPEEAEKVMQRASEAGAADPAALLNIGIAFLNKKEYERAAPVLQRVIDLEAASAADEAMAYALLGRCQMSQGQMKEGIASLEQSLATDPQGAMAEENRQILESVKKK